ncbi:MAG: ABC transporter ATP-binding protein [bacterium]|nr:ABC transporter ATP-binding protein [bacterium]
MKKFGVLWRYIWQRPWLITISLLCTILGTLLYSAQPYFIAIITDLATQKNFVDLEFVLLIFLSSILLSTICFLFSAHLGNKSMASVSVHVLHDVMAKIHDLDFAYHTNKSSGKILSLINRGDDAIYIFCDAFYFQFVEILIGFAFMFVSFSQLSWQYALLVALNFIVTLLACLWILKINIAKRSIFNRDDTQLTAEKVDNLINFETVKYFAKEKYELHKLDQTLKRWEKSLMDYFFTFRFFDAAIGVTNVAFLLGVFWLAVLDLQNSVFVLADFIFVITFALGFKWRMDSFINILRHVAKKNEDLEKYLEILEQKSTLTDPAEPQVIQNFRGEIKFDDVSFEYDNRKKLALNHVNLTIKPGEVVALVGFSGAGKTTIVKLLQRMYDVTSGKITIDGVDLRAMTREYLRDKIGIVPQESILFNNSIKYNLAYARPDASETEIMAAAQAAQADDFIAKLPDGYETKVGERGVKLSGGQRQRLAIARVLLKKPKIIVFDEATSSLDSYSEQAIQKSFWAYVRGKKQAVTAIVIAHRLSTIMKADRIIVMCDGKIAEMGTHDQLLRQGNSIYRQLWRLQANGFIGDGESEETNPNTHEKDNSD